LGLTWDLIFDDYLIFGAFLFLVSCIFFQNMHYLSFFSRVAFICNICLLLALLSRYFSFIPKGDIESTIIIDGLILSFIINGTVNAVYTLLWLRKRKISEFAPGWLARINFLFLIFQLLLLLLP
jgi:hypothetical protein